MNRFYYISLATLLALLGYLNYRLFEPFFIPLAWAFVLAILFYPAHAFLFRHVKWRSLSSLLTTLLILLVILGPFTYISFLLVQELRTALDFTEKGRLDFLRDLVQHPFLKSALERATALFSVTPAEVHQAVADSVSQLGKELIGRVTKGVTGIAAAALHFFLMAFTLFFFLRDGPALLKTGREYLPFSGEQKNQLAQRVKDIIISTLYGGVIVAIAQGTVGGIAFYLVGIESPVIWGLTMAVASFLPVVGAFAVWVPAVVYLFIQGEIGGGVALLLMGILGVSTIDNVLRPWIIGNRTRMPFIGLFFSVLGGLKLFGLIGIVLGPMVLALFVSTIDIIRRIDAENQPRS